MKGLVEARIFADLCSYKLVTQLTQLCGFWENCYICFGKVGLKVPILSSKFDIQKHRPLIREFLKVGVLSGVSLGIILTLVSIFSEQMINSEIFYSQLNSELSLVTRLMYGGVTEEIIMRFGLMTFLV
jgi:hypothetical protein